MAARLGDRAWRDLLQRFHALCRAQLVTCRGVETDTAGDKVSGMVVHIGARVMSQAGNDEVWVSSTTRDLVAGSGIAFEDRGAHALKGVPGEWNLSRALVPGSGS